MSEPQGRSAELDARRWELTLSSPSRRESVQISVGEVDQTWHPSVNLYCVVTDGSFTGSDDVWVSEPQLADFVSQLQHLEQSRAGCAKLEAMSPGRLELVIEPFDGARHMQVSATISANRYGPRMSHCTVTMRSIFEIDAGLLMSVLIRFRELWHTCGGGSQKRDN